MPVVAIGEILRIRSRARPGVPIIEKGPTNCQVTGGRAERSASSSPRLGPAARKSRARGAESAPARIVARVRWAGLPPRALGVWSYGDAEALPKEPGRSARGGRPGVAALALQGGFRDRHRWRHVDPPVVRAGLADRRQAERPHHRQPAALNSPTEINQIIVGGTDPLHSRLVGRVTKGPNGDGQVFFQNLTELTSRSDILGAGNGLLAINMPNFLLGNTTPATVHDHSRRHALDRRSPTASTRSASAASIPRTTRSPRPSSTRDERQLLGHARPAPVRRDPDHHRQVDQQHPVGHRLRLDDADDHPARRDLQRLGPARPVPGQLDPGRRD